MVVKSILFKKSIFKVNQKTKKLCYIEYQMSIFYFIN